jgi:acyl-CoA thioester hydrolase
MGSWQKMVEEHGVDAVVAEAAVRYLTPLRFDEEIDLVTRVVELGKTSMRIAIAVERDGEVCAEGENRYVVVDPAGGAKTPIPDAVREALAPFAA